MLRFEKEASYAKLRIGIITFVPRSVRQTMISDSLLKLSLSHSEIAPKCVKTIGPYLKERSTDRANFHL